MTAEGRLAGKSALVTGAGSGIGKAISLLFGREGAKVMAADINEEAAGAVSAQIEDYGGEARRLRADTSSEEDVRAAIQAVVDAWGQMDILVNNAGIGGPQYSWDQVIAVNQSGVFYGCLHGLAQMQKQGGGAIVNTASMAGLIGAFVPGFPGGFGYAYIAAKHGVLGLTKQFGLDGAPHNVRVNAICPGWIDTPLIAPVKEAPPMLDWAVQNTPMGRLGRPEEIAKAVLFLASDDSSFMTGAYLVVDGGYTARSSKKRANGKMETRAVMNEVKIYPLSPDRWGDFEKLFGLGGGYGGCWCMWPRLRSKDWGASRSAGRKEAMRAIVAAEEPPGLLAYLDGEPVGWVSLDRRERLEHFEYARKLKGLGRPDGLWSIVCFVIDKGHRKEGLMSRLLEGALDFARGRGARVVEAYPIEPLGELKSYQGFEGIASVFERAGFVQVGGTEARPVMRLVID